MAEKIKKANRVLMLLYRLSLGERVSKADYAAEAGISVRSAERDMREIRTVLTEMGDSYTLLLDEAGRLYFSNNGRRKFSETEVLFISKVLLSSRSLCREEMRQVIAAMSSLFGFAVRNEIKAAIQSELEQYVEPQHGKRLLALHWDLTRAMQCQLKIALRYRKLSGEVVCRKVLPISIVSSEYYLYLVGFFEEKAYEYPAFFRLDRILTVEKTDEHYNPRLFSDYNMGKMKQCIQFMYAGRLLRVRLRCENRALEAVRDRLPNHRIVAREEGHTILQAKVFGEGFCRWILQYGRSVEVLEPQELREKIRRNLQEAAELYT